MNGAAIVYIALIFIRITFKYKTGQRSLQNNFYYLLSPDLSRSEGFISVSTNNKHEVKRFYVIDIQIHAGQSLNFNC